MADVANNMATTQKEAWSRCSDGGGVGLGGLVVSTFASHLRAWGLEFHLRPV